MAVALYMDEQVEDAITRGLHRRGVDVLRVQDDGHARTDDELVLDRAGVLGRVVSTRDDDFLVIAQRRQSTGVPFAGVVYAHKLGPSVDACVRDLELIATAYDPPDMADRVEYLPL
jgi:hypothetical protein